MTGALMDERLAVGSAACLDVLMAGSTGACLVDVKDASMVEHLVVRKVA